MTSVRCWISDHLATVMVLLAIAFAGACLVDFAMDYSKHGPCEIVEPERVVRKSHRRAWTSYITVGESVVPIPQPPRYTLFFEGRRRETGETCEVAIDVSAEIYLRGEP